MIFFFVKKFHILTLLVLSYVSLQISNFSIFSNRPPLTLLIVLIILNVFF